MHISVLPYFLPFWLIIDLVKHILRVLLLPSTSTLRGRVRLLEVCSQMLCMRRILPTYFHDYSDFVMFGYVRAVQLKCDVKRLSSAYNLQISFFLGHWCSQKFAHVTHELKFVVIIECQRFFSNTQRLKK